MYTPYTLYRHLVHSFCHSFCCDGCLVVWCLTILYVLYKSSNSAFQKSNLLFNMSVLTCFLIDFATIVFHSLNYPTLHNFSSKNTTTPFLNIHQWNSTVPSLYECDTMKHFWIITAIWKNNVCNYWSHSY